MSNRAVKCEKCGRPLVPQPDPPPKKIINPLRLFGSLALVTATFLYFGGSGQKEAGLFNLVAVLMAFGGILLFLFSGKFKQPTK